MRLGKFDGVHEKLSLFASKDETRPHLSTIIFDTSINRVCSTDGHRLFATKKYWDDEKAGNLYDLDVFALSNKFSKVEDIKKTIPTKNVHPIFSEQKYQIIWTIPLWLEKFKKLKVGKKNSIYFYFDASTKPPCVSITSRKKQPSVVCINGILLAPFAGEQVVISWRDEASPLLVGDPNHADNPYNGEWYALIMPIRYEDHGNVEDILIRTSDYFGGGKYQDN